jgi:hypothetical protein
MPASPTGDQVVCAEGCNVTGLLTNPSLAKCIADMERGELLRHLESKAR